MREIRFRGIDVDTGKYVYGAFVHSVPMSSFAGIVDDNGIVHKINLQAPAQLIGRDGDGEDIYEGDALTVDLVGLKVANGVGLMADELATSRPKGDATLKIFDDEGRWQLYWTTRSGRIDTGLDWRVIKPYIKFFTVKEAQA